MANRGLEITWLGHAALRVRSNGHVFYIDPFLSQNPKCPPSERQPELADVVLVTHGHGDHVGDALAIAQQTGAEVVGIYELAQWLTHKGLPPKQAIGMNKGGILERAGARIRMVQALHSSSMEENGVSIYLGEAAGYVVEFAEGLTVYFAGDTALFGDMRLIGERYQPDLACLPIGDFYTMGPEDAAYACRLLGVRAVLPIHWGTFPALPGNPEQLREQLQGTDCEVIALQPGESYSPPVARRKSA